MFSKEMITVIYKSILLGTTTSYLATYLLDYIILNGIPYTIQCCWEKKLPILKNQSELGKRNWTQMTLIGKCFCFRISIHSNRYWTSFRYGYVNYIQYYGRRAYSSSSTLVCRSILVSIVYFFYYSYLKVFALLMK